MAALAFHFGKGDDDISELVGLSKPSPAMARAFHGDASPPAARRVVVLVCPTYYKQRPAFYADRDDLGVEVFPLLFNWRTLTASHIRSLMRLDDQSGGGQQLYVSVLLNLLRRYQQDGKHPNFDDFFDEVK